jgi:hypothetical protein
MWNIDFEAGACGMDLADGRVATIPFPHPAPSKVIKRLRVDFEHAVMQVSLDDETLLEVELASRRAGSPPGVPIVYLDQNQWVELAQRQDLA